MQSGPVSRSQPDSPKPALQMSLIRDSILRRYREGDDLVSSPSFIKTSRALFNFNAMSVQFTLLTKWPQIFLIEIAKVHPGNVHERECRPGKSVDRRHRLKSGKPRSSFSVGRSCLCAAARTSNHRQLGTHPHPPHRYRTRERGISRFVNSLIALGVGLSHEANRNPAIAPLF